MNAIHPEAVGKIIEVDVAGLLDGLVEIDGAAVSSPPHPQGPVTETALHSR